MKKTTLLALAALFITSNVKGVEIFYFSFTGTLQGPIYQDTIEGTLTLNDSENAATSLVVTNDVQSNIIISDADFVLNAAVINNNTFTVSTIDGIPTITSANFYSVLGNGGHVVLNQPDGYGRYFISEYYSPYLGGRLSVNDSVESLGGVTFTSVPEPSTYALLGLGVMAIVSNYRRKATDRIRQTF